MTSLPEDDVAHLVQERMTALRLGPYLRACDQDVAQAVSLYRWNSAMSSALWEVIGHLEIVVRNVIDERAQARHTRLGRSGTWLDDPDQELQQKACKDISKARSRVRQKQHGKVTHGHTVAELSFGFWRYLLARHYQSTLWPEIASGFRHAPNRSRKPIETLLAEIHQFRNRIAHHEPIWRQDPVQKEEQAAKVLHYVDPRLAVWVLETSRVQEVWDVRPEQVATRAR